MATAGGADDGLQLREAELDRVEIRTVRGQIPEGRVGALDGVANAVDLVRAEVIYDDDVAGLQRRHQDLFDVGQEADAVDRAIEDAWRSQAGDPDRLEKCAGLPPRTWRVIVDAGPAQGPAVPSEEIGGDASFIEKHKAGRVPGRRPSLPRHARGRDVRPIVFGRAYRFF